MDWDWLAPAIAAAVVVVLAVLGVRAAPTADRLAAELRLRIHRRLRERGIYSE